MYRDLSRQEALLTHSQTFFDILRHRGPQVETVRTFLVLLSKGTG